MAELWRVYSLDFWEFVWLLYMRFGNKQHATLYRIRSTKSTKELLTRGVSMAMLPQFVVPNDHIVVRQRLNLTTHS